MHTQLIYDVLMSELVAAGPSASYTYCFPTDTDVIATIFPLRRTSYITICQSCFVLVNILSRNVMLSQILCWLSGDIMVTTKLQEVTAPVCF